MQDTTTAAAEQLAKLLSVPQTASRVAEILTAMLAAEQAAAPAPAPKKAAPKAKAKRQSKKGRVVKHRKYDQYVAEDVLEAKSKFTARGWNALTWQYRAFRLAARAGKKAYEPQPKPWMLKPEHRNQ